MATLPRIATTICNYFKGWRLASRGFIPVPRRLIKSACLRPSQNVFFSPLQHETSLAFGQLFVSWPFEELRPTPSPRRLLL